MRTKIQKWGNSYAVRISKDIVETAHLELGAEIELEVRDKQVILHVMPKKRKTLKSIVDGLKAARQKEKEVDWGPPQGSEVW